MQKLLVLLVLLAACVLLPILVAQLVSGVAPVSGVELALLYVLAIAGAAVTWRRVSRKWRRA